MSTERGQVLAVADAGLRIVLADPGLAHVARWEHAAVVGRGLPELFPHPEIRSDLKLLEAGVAREVRLANIEPDRIVTASLASSFVDGSAQSSVIVRTRPLPESPPAHTETLVGRADELEAFDHFLAGPNGAMLVVEGPLGIGKSALLRAFDRRCRRVSAPIFWLDGRASSFDGDVMTSLASFQYGADSLLQFAGTLAGRPWVVVVDHFDVGLEDALAERTAFFRSLPPTCRLVVAVRSHSKPFGALLPRHRPLVCQLGPLSSGDARTLASLVGVAEADPRIQQTRGHPLSIRALVKSVVHSDPLDDLAYQGELPVARDALEIAALPRRITEDVLTMLSGDAALAGETYDALGAVCMPDPSNVGLLMPESVRNALATRLERRNPIRYAALRRDIIRYLLRRLEANDVEHSALLLDDLFDSFDGHPTLRRIYGSPASSVAVERMTQESPEDVRAVLRSLGRPDAGAILTRFNNGTPTYIAERNGRLAGLMQLAILSTADAPANEDRRETAVRAQFRRFAGPGEIKLGALLAFAVAKDEGEEWREVAQAISREHLRALLTTRGVAGSLLLVDSAARMFADPSDEVIDLAGARTHLRDFQKESLVRRLAAAVDRGDDDVREAHGPDPKPGLTTEAVRLALSNLTGKDENDRPLLDAIDALTDRRQHEVLRAVYVERHGKHELIAAELGLSYSTFRRHHTRGIERVRELLIDHPRSKPTSASDSSKS